MSALILTLTSLVLTTPTLSDAKLPTSLDLETIRALPVQHDGRVPPLDTLARDLVESVTGEAYYQGHDPVLLLLAWTWDSETWAHEPLIAIESQELREELRLSATQTVFSHAELMDHHYLHTLASQFRRLPPDHKPNPLESKVSDIYDKLTTLQYVFSEGAITPIPDPESVGGAWQAIEPVASEELPEADPIQTAWAMLRSAFLADDGPAFAAASDQLVAALRAQPAAYRPTEEQIDTELRYNRLRAFRTAWIAMVAGVAFALLALLCRLGQSTAATVLAKITHLLALAGMVVGFAVLTYGLWLRWQIAGRIPAANMFESLLFLSWGAGAFGIVSLLALRDRFVPLTASTMGALALILADCLPLDHYIRPIMPVLLDTIWMSIHVPIIMVSYAVLAVAVLIAHGQLLVMATVPRRRELAVAVDSLHYWYVFVGALLLLAGIVTGSMWGASSWGRYWGWDPKEVWSLIAFLGYLAILHVRADHQRVAPWAYVIGALLGIALFALVLPKLEPLTPLKTLAFAGTAVAAIIFVVARGPFATALKSILAFWLIIMTYVGVNYVLGIGLHSYGFGTGAVVHYMFLVGGIDLVLVALCTTLYVFRRPPPTDLAAASVAAART